MQTVLHKTSKGLSHLHSRGSLCALPPSNCQASTRLYENYVIIYGISQSLVHQRIGQSNISSSRSSNKDSSSSHNKGCISSSSKGRISSSISSSKGNTSNSNSSSSEFLTQHVVTNRSHLNNNKGPPASLPTMFPFSSKNKSNPVSADSPNK